jgi:hypothetical protein
MNIPTASPKHILVLQNPKELGYHGLRDFLYISIHEYNRLLIQLHCKEDNLCIPRNQTARPCSHFPYSDICERFINSQDRYTYFAAAKLADRLWEYINRSQMYDECSRNWDRSFLSVNIFPIFSIIFAVWSN